MRLKDVPAYHVSAPVALFFCQKERLKSDRNVLAGPPPGHATCGVRAACGLAVYMYSIPGVICTLGATLGCIAKQGGVAWRGGLVA